MIFKNTQPALQTCFNMFISRIFHLFLSVNLLVDHRIIIFNNFQN